MLILSQEETKMRKSQLSVQEVAEMDEMNRVNTRNSGFSLMSVRDKGYIRLGNGCLMQWHVDRQLKDGEARQVIPDGMVMIDDKFFNAEELQKYLRWA